jgi:hypothetical protein
MRIRFLTTTALHVILHCHCRFALAGCIIYRIILNQLDDIWRLSDGHLESFKILREQLASVPIHTPKILLSYFKMHIEKEYKMEGALDMAMAKLVLDKKSKVFYSFVKVFFPRPQDIRAFYPETGNWMLPVNYLRFIFWRVTKLTVFTK